MMTTIKDLREIARRCAIGQPLTAELAQWLGRSLGEYLSHRAGSIDEAFGLRASRGGVPWWREEAIRRRDGMLRQLAQRHFPTASVSQQARQIYLLALRYAAAAWRFDRQRDEMPIGYAGTVKEELWSIFKTGAPMPRERHLRTILAQSKRVCLVGEEAQTAADRIIKSRY